jgi:hypothetical protein
MVKQSMLCSGLCTHKVTAQKKILGSIELAPRVP